MDGMKNSFVFYKSWQIAIEQLPGEIRLEVYESIMKYAFGETVEGLKPLAQLAFSFIKQDLDRSNSNYQKIIERNRENGKKGGRPKKTQDNPENPPGFLKTRRNPDEDDQEDDDDSGMTVPDGTEHTELPDGNSSGSFSFQPENKTRARGKTATCFDTAKYNEFEPAIKRWLAYKAEIKDGYKSQQSVDVMARNLWKLAHEQPEMAMRIVDQSIGNNWKGLFELKNGHVNGTSKNTDGGFSDEYKADILRRMGAI